MIQPRAIDEYQEPPDGTFPPEQPPVLVPAAVVSSVLETLTLLDEFFRDHTSSTARAELAAFAALHGWVPDQGAQLIIEGIGIHADSLIRVRAATDAHQQ